MNSEYESQEWENKCKTKQKAKTGMDIDAWVIFAACRFLMKISKNSRQANDVSKLEIKIWKWTFFSERPDAGLGLSFSWF